MSEMSDYMRSSAYIRSYTQMESSSLQKGIIYIEDASDRCFWTLVVNTVYPDRYDIKPFSKPGSQGKRRLEQEYDKLHKDYLVAVDADYDYICPDRNEFSSILNTNPFVLHTFCYSRESYLHIEESVEYLINSIYLNVPTKSYIIQALERYSGVIFDALCLFTWIHNHDIEQCKEELFNGSIKLQPGFKILNEDLSVNEEVIANLERNVGEFIEYHKQFINDIDAFNEHKEMLKNRGINSGNALLFVNGHDLLNGIFIPIYDMYINKSRRNDMEWVSANFQDRQEKDRKRQVANHYNDNCKITAKLFNCERFSSSPFWEKIIEKLTKIEAIQ